MKINKTINSPNFKGSVYNSRLLKNSLLFASNNSALFCATTSLILSTVARPLAIMSTPKTDKENKKYAVAKSISSSIVGYLLMFLISEPISKAVKNIDMSPEKYLNKQTIQNLQKGSASLSGSKKYQFATQLFKLGLGLFIAIPKSTLTSYLIPKIVKKLPKEEKKQSVSFKGSLYSKGTDKIAKGIGEIINTKPVQNLSEKLYKTNFAQMMMYLTDFVLTGAFVSKTLKNKNIEEKRKKPLVYNSLLSTAFSTISSLTINKLTDKQFQKFTRKFIDANKNSKNLDKYIEGLNIAKLSIIMGVVYYIFIPILSTFLSDKLDKIKSKPQN